MIYFIKKHNVSYITRQKYDKPKFDEITILGYDGKNNIIKNPTFNDTYFSNQVRVLLSLPIQPISKLSPKELKIIKNL